MSNIAPMQRLARTAAWLLPLSLLLMAIVAVPLRILDEQGLPRYRALRAELAEVDGVNDRLRHQLADLRRDVDGLTTEPSMIERIARDELGMVRAEEIVFQFPE